MPSPKTAAQRKFQRALDELYATLRSQGVPPETAAAAITEAWERWRSHVDLEAA